MNEVICGQYSSIDDHIPYYKFDEEIKGYVRSVHGTLITLFLFESSSKTETNKG